MTIVFIKYRERFSSGVELRTAVQAEVANPKSPQRGTANKFLTIFQMDQLQPLHCPFQQIQPVSLDTYVNPAWLMQISITLILFNNVTKINIQREKKKAHQIQVSQDV